MALFCATLMMSTIKLLANDHKYFYLIAGFPK